MNETIQSHHTPLHPAPTHYSADELKRMRDETLALLTAGMKAAASRVVDSLQPPAPDDRLALAEGLKRDLARAQAAFAARGPQAVHEAARFACDALRLSRVCHRAGCRRAQTCRGDAAACFEHAPVPEPVRQWAARLLLAKELPWLPMLAGENAANRTAYEGWVAGIEAGR